MMRDMGVENKFPDVILLNPERLYRQHDLSKVLYRIRDFVTVFDEDKLNILFNVLYGRLGLPVLETQLYRGDEFLGSNIYSISTGQLTDDMYVELVEQPIDTYPKDIEAIKRLVRENYVTHVLFGNKSAVNKGLGYNFYYDGMIKFYSNYWKFLDLKSAKDFIEAGSVLHDIDLKQIHQDKRWLGELTEEEIQHQVDRLIRQKSIIENTLREMGQRLQISLPLQHRLLSVISNRFDRLATLNGYPVQRFALRDKAAVVNETAAGVMHLERDERGELSVLLIQQKEYGWCDNFFGPSEEGDGTLLRTAQRVVEEESDGVLNYSDEVLALASFHDLITGNRRHLYRLYFIEAVRPIEMDLLNDINQSNHHRVLLKDLITAVQMSEPVIHMGVETVEVVDVDGVRVVIFPILYRMLQQSQVRSLLQQYSSGKQPKQYTQGLIDQPDASPNDIYQPINVNELMKQAVISASISQAHVTENSRLQLNSVFEAANNETEINEFAETPLTMCNTIWSVVEAMIELPRAKRLKFAQFNEALIKDGYDLSNVLAVIPMDERLRFANQQRSKILRGGQMKSVLKRLSNRRRMDFIRDQEGMKYNELEIHAIFELLPINRRSEFLKSQQVKNPGESLCITMGLLPVNARFEYLVDSLNKRSIDLNLINRNVRRSLPADKRMAFTIAYFSKIDVIEELRLVLSGLKSYVRSWVAKMYHEWFQTLNDVFEVASCLPPNDANEFILMFGDLRDDIDEVKALLDVLSVEHRKKFALMHHSVIKQYIDLVTIVKYLHESDRLDLILCHQDKIKDCLRLVKLSHHLSISDGAKLFAAQQDKFRKFEDFVTCLSVMERLIEYDRCKLMSFVITYQHTIQTGKELELVLRMLPKNERLSFAVANQHKIQDDDSLSAVLKVLPESVKAKFETDCRNSILARAALIKQVNAQLKFGVFGWYTKAQPKIEASQNLSVSEDDFCWPVGMIARS